MENSKLQNLPIFKHFEGSEISKSVDSFRKGEKSLFTIVKLLAIASVGYFSWIYVLPVVFKAAGQMIALATTGIILVALVLLAPVIFKALRRFTRVCHKSVIKHDPFGELDDQRYKMEDNKKKLQSGKGKINNLKSSMEISAAESEKNAKTYESKIIKLKTSADKIKKSMETLLKTSGDAAKGTDEYVNYHADFVKVVSESQRMAQQLSQEKDFVKKYGTRAAIMKKFGHKLLIAETMMDNKILDFDATVTILKKDYAFAKESREATNTVKDTMMFTEGWEVEYALDVVTSTIAQDIAITAGNLNDIDSLTSTYSFDSDELYASLDTLANDINTGADPIVSAKQYSNPEYKLSHDDKLKSGGFGEMF